jgi:hypothetical protein
MAGWSHIQHHTGGHQQHHDAGPKVQYQVAIGPGTYAENVQMIDYIYLIGAGQTATIITAPGQQSFANGTVNTGGNSGISDCTILGTGGGWGTCPMCIKLTGQGDFHLKGVTLIASDDGNDGNNVVSINNNAAGSSNASVIIGQSIVKAIAKGSGTASALSIFYTGVNIWSDLCTFEADGNMAYGVVTTVGATAVLNDSKIIGTAWALYNSDGMSPITANQCTISGPVSNGVVVNY